MNEASFLLYFRTVHEVDGIADFEYQNTTINRFVSCCFNIFRLLCCVGTRP